MQAIVKTVLMYLVSVITMDDPFKLFGLMAVVQCRRLVFTAVGIL